MMSFTVKVFIGVTQPPKKSETIFVTFSFYIFPSMTQLLSHTFAHPTGPSFRLKAKLLPNKIFLGLT